MALREWPPAQIVGLWVTLAGLLIALLMVGNLTRRRITALQERMAVSSQPSADSATVVTYHYFRSVVQAPADSDYRQELRALLANPPAANRDSVWRALGLPAALTPAQRDSFPGYAVRAMAAGAVPLLPRQEGGGDHSLLAMLVIAAAGGLPILVLGYVTLRWYAERSAREALRRVTG